jgi:methionyl aminopeptidase
MRKPFFASLRPKLQFNGSGQSIGSAFPMSPGQVSPTRAVPSHIPCPDYHRTGEPGAAPNQVVVYTRSEIDRIRESARLARKMLDFANSLVAPGITTDEIDRLTHDEIVRHGACPSPINYYGFPKAICTSVNEVVCHGIPDDRPLMDGDVVSIDVSVFYNGYHGDNCGTVVCGNSDGRLDRLMEATQEALRRSISVCKPGR